MFMFFIDSLVFESNCRGIVRTYCNKRQAEMSSGSGDHAPVVAYEDLLEAQKDPAILIIDVREDAEIAETGKLPGSIHIPSKFDFLHSSFGKIYIIKREN